MTGTSPNTVVGVRAGMLTAKDVALNSSKQDEACRAAPKALWMISDITLWLGVRAGMLTVKDVAPTN